MLSVKQVGIKYHFLCPWNVSACDLTPVSWIIAKHSNHYANWAGQYIYKYIYIYIK